LLVGKTRISVVVAVLNAEASLGGCLDSVIAQDYQNLQLVVIDGGSSDASVEMIRAREESISYWESCSDRGIYHAWNKGLARVEGDWVHFLGSDDRFASSDALSRVAEWLHLCNTETRIAYGRVAVVSQRGEVLETIGGPWDEARCRMRTGMPVPFPAVFLHRSLFNIQGGFDESFQISGDYEFLLRELIDRPPLFLDNLVVTLMALGGKSSSRENRLLRCVEDARARTLHGLFPYPAPWCWEFAKNCVYRILDNTLGTRAALLAQLTYRRLVGPPYGH
jgi:glycosyltransferase involved in cell wall biosynthesis